MRVDNGDDPSDQAAKEGHQHRLHHVVLGQGPPVHGSRHVVYGAIILQRRIEVEEGAAESERGPEEGRGED